MLEQKIEFLESNEMVIKRPGPNYKNIKNNFGGNRKWQTFKFCHQCKKEYGPVTHLKSKYCSIECKNKGIVKSVKKPKWKVPNKIRAAQRRISYLISVGKMVRPDKCEFCKKNSYIEAAHKDYNKPEDIYWLCRTCHRKYDKKEPKIKNWITHD